MKTLRQIILVLAAGVALSTTAAAAQDKSASHQGVHTNYMAGRPFSLELKNAPSMRLGANLIFTGLAVDILRPQETWKLFNPAVPAMVMEEPVRPMPAILAPPPPLNDDQAAHTANFAFLRISFP